MYLRDVELKHATKERLIARPKPIKSLWTNYLLSHLKVNANISYTDMVIFEVCTIGNFLLVGLISVVGLIY